MNIFVPQSLQTKIELEEIVAIERQIITPALSVPIIGIKQDGLLGAYNLTQPSMKIDWKSAMNMMSYTTLDDFSVFKKDMEYNGADLFSLIIPDQINTSGAVEVKNGKIEKGVINSKMLGSKQAHNLIHLIWDQYGIDKTTEFINNVQRLINNFNLWNGFSVGIGDIDVSKEIEEQIHTMIETKKLEVQHLITEMENNPDLVDPEIAEETISALLGTIRDEVSKLIMANLKPNNSFRVMISSGSAGSDTNMGQMGGCLGQQNVEGNRPLKTMNGRALPYFHQGDDTAKARGFIQQPFIKGVHPIEFIFSNMSGREGLIDTAIKSVTGDTPIVIIENDIAKHVNIGDWIDQRLKESESEVEHHEERDMELLKLKDDVIIPTTDENGNVSWSQISAITRHDPGKELYEIKTYGGRQVIVTESKSLLIWNNNKFERMSTPDVRVGDFVPVTMSLAKPEKISNFIEMARYFPKNEYVYGTDFNIAIKELNKIMEGRDKVPIGWWNENNGKLFTLPYDQAARFRRTTVRSNIKNIKDGYIYPFATNREDILVPDRFELNRDNGLFIGLFLAEGNVDLGSGYIQITNNNPKIRDFVKKWYDSLSIKYKENIKINQIGGTTSDVRGYSTILGKFLTKLVGHGARNKHIPYEAYNAPEEFIIGILDGYFSGDGTITKSSVDVSSASSELINGINMLCSRLGMFGRVSKRTLKSNNVGTKDIAEINCLSLRGTSARKFADKINLIEESKSNRLKQFKILMVNKNYNVHNDVVLDRIISIDKVDISKYPKVYDLTVPSTLNFGLANGLHVVDTAESGYVQRKLIKAMEDLSVKYDSTVRNSNNTILQFTYADNGIDTTKQSIQYLKFLEMGNKEIAEKVKFTNQELKNYDLSDKQNEDYYEDLLRLRDSLRTSKMKMAINNITFDNSFMLPVNIKNIIVTIKNNLDIKGGKLEPKHVIKRIEEILDYKNTKITSMSQSDANDKDTLKYKDELMAKSVFRFALYEYLSPKVCIFDHKLDKAKFDQICDTIIEKFNKSVVEAGEMVGVVAAQSIGEPTTQIWLL